LNNLRSALVIGASRGIGLAITRALLRRTSTGLLYATYRNAESAQRLIALKDPRLTLCRAEVTDRTSLQELAREIRQSSVKPELVVHCAGILHEPGLQPEKSLRHCQPDALRRLFEVNSIGPLMTAQCIVPLMPKNRSTHFAALSAMVGSIGDNRLGGWYGYRASKAALNQFLRTLSIECRRTHPELCVTAIHPGTTDTALSAPFQSNVKPEKLYTPEQSADRILEVVLAGTPKESGRFVNWDGNPLPF
jgi:NAD(P)-dependent dehydrogenase (short-subunit alcohol dehydrogenase family)